MNRHTRTVTTHYETADGAEHAIQVDVAPDPTRYDPSNVRIETDLSDVPASERAGVVEHATELYWQLVSSEHESRSEGQEGGFPGHREDA